MLVARGDLDCDRELLGSGWSLMVLDTYELVLRVGERRYRGRRFNSGKLRLRAMLADL